MSRHGTRWRPSSISRDARIGRSSKRARSSKRIRSSPTRGTSWERSCSRVARWTRRRCTSKRPPAPRRRTRTSITSSRARTKSSTVSQYHYLLGVALMEGGDMPAAIESLQQADRLEPERSLTLMALGLAENNRKQYADAKRALHHALDLEPENIDALAALAEAEAGLDELAPAEDHARRALRRAVAHPTANLGLGIVSMKPERS